MPGATFVASLLLELRFQGFFLTCPNDLCLLLVLRVNTTPTPHRGETKSFRTPLELRLKSSPSVSIPPCAPFQRFSKVFAVQRFYSSMVVSLSRTQFGCIQQLAYTSSKMACKTRDMVRLV